MKFGCIGCGKMGHAIIGGITKAKLFTPSDIFVYEVNEAVKANLSDEGYNVVGAANELFEECEVVLFAIKPQEAKSVISSLNSKGNCKLAITIMAGVPISTLEQIDSSLAVCRVMPNTCALLGESASSICFNSACTSNEKELAKKIVSSFGMFVELDETQMDDIIPAGGSFTAYAYLFMKAFIDSSVKRGIDIKTATDLVIQSMIGSAKMVKESNKPIEQLINDVCSKGGTTLAGLDILYANNFEKIIDDCAKACADRSRELGKLK